MVIKLNGGWGFCLKKRKRTINIEKRSKQIMLTRKLVAGDMVIW
jgi:hypothetical protein